MSPIAALWLALKGATVVDAEPVFDMERSISHGNVAAAHVMAGKLGLRPLLGPACPDRDIAHALIISRAVRPGSKQPTVRWWNAGDTTLAPDLGVDKAATDDPHSDRLHKEFHHRGFRSVHRRLHGAGSAVAPRSGSLCRTDSCQCWQARGPGPATGRWVGCLGGPRRRPGR
jgi:hypothetical protein